MSMLEGLRSIGRVPRERWISPPGIVNLPRRFRNGAPVTATSAALSFDLSEATKYLAQRDECLKRLFDVAPSLFAFEDGRCILLVPERSLLQYWG